MNESTTILRNFLRANAKADGAMEALDALHTLESAVLDAEGQRAREAAFSAAIVDAQKKVVSAYKRTSVDLGQGRGAYKVAETEQLLQLCRDQMADFGLALEVGDSEVVVIASQGYLRIKFGLRHRDGFVRVVTRDFPLSGRGDPATILRQSNTSALGYFLRDAFALPRLKDEGEAAAAVQERSGPRRAATVREERRQPPPSDAPLPDLGEKAQAIHGAILAANESALGKAEHRVADLRAALDSEEPPHTEAEVRAFERAIVERRQQLTGNLL